MHRQTFIYLRMEVMTSQQRLKCITQIARQKRNKVPSYFIAFAGKEEQGCILGGTKSLEEVFKEYNVQKLQLSFIFCENPIFYCDIFINNFQFMKILLEPKGQTIEKQCFDLINYKLKSVKQVRDIMIQVIGDIRQDKFNKINAIFKTKYLLQQQKISNKILKNYPESGKQIIEKMHHYYVQQLICPITLKIYELPIQTDCLHIFERDALIKWLQNKGNCPCCRSFVKTMSISVKILKRIISLHYVIGQ